MAVKVLIVESNPVARSFLCRVVRESFSDELDITKVGDLDSARREMRQHFGPSGSDGYQLALLDLELPDGNGLELLAELAGHSAMKIVTTLYSDDDHLFPALQCGADGYLLKEDRFEVLVEEMQKIVRGQPPLSPAIARRMLTHFRAVGQHSGALGDYMPPTPAFQDAATPSAAAAVRERPTQRESEVLVYLSKGFTIKEIASLMGIKWFTVNDHIKTIYQKMNVSSPSEAAVFASRQRSI